MTYELLDPRKKARLVNLNFIFVLISSFFVLSLSRIAHESQIIVKMTNDCNTITHEFHLRTKRTRSVVKHTSVADRARDYTVEQ